MEKNGKNGQKIKTANVYQLKTLAVLDAENLVWYCSKKLGYNTDFHKLDKWIQDNKNIRIFPNNSMMEGVA